VAGTDFSEPEIDRFVMAITTAEAIIRHTTRHQIELPHVAVELNQARSLMRLITFILSSAIALTCIPAFASAASKTFSPASVSTACPTYEGYPDCH
jgi:hypothetical protein